MKLKISFSTESPTPKGGRSSDEIDKKGRSTMNALEAGISWL
jgi:hypothetical protein